MQQYQLIPPNQLHPNPDNPRHEAGDISELARSIDEVGQLQPCLVRLAPELSFGNPDDLEYVPHYYIEAGYRRWVVLKSRSRLVECRIREPLPGESPRRRNLIVGVSENLQRVDLNAMEKAKAYGRLRDEEEMTQEEIAKAIGVHSTSVNRSLALLELAPRTQESVRRGDLKVEDALQLVRNFRAKQRKKSGKKNLNVEWEPDWLTERHPQARSARTMCEARGHTSRRRIGRVACGQCWESAIRQDEDIVIKVKYEQAGQQKPSFLSWPVDHPMSNGA